MLVGIFLSAVSVSASFLVNCLVAFMLPLEEYAIWIKSLSLLPFVSSFISPIVFSNARIDIKSIVSTQQAKSILVMLLTTSTITTLLIIMFCKFYNSKHVSVYALWSASLGRVAVEGLLWNTQIIKYGVWEKVARCILPLISFFLILAIRPTTFNDTCLSIAFATVLGGATFLLWLIKSTSFVKVTLKTFLFIYYNDIHALYISIVSLGIFSIPIYIYSLKSTADYTAYLGFTIALVTSASAFTNSALSQKILYLCQSINRRKDIKIYNTIYLLILFICVGTIFFTILFCTKKNISNMFILSFATGILVLIETSQGIITSMLLRLGEKKIVFSTTFAAIANITIVCLFENPVFIVAAFSTIQLVAFLIPGLFLLSLKNRKNDYNTNIN